MTSLATFNANNFFLRYKFSKTYPGDMSKKSLIEASEAAMMGYLPEKAFGKYSPKSFIIWEPERRKLAIKALKEPDGKLPDILCFQEVENMDAIRAFNENYLKSYYQYSLLIDGYDPRNIDVGVLSTLPIEEIRSHIDESKNGKRIFSRDCLEVTLILPDGEKLILFVNHLKSKLVIKKKNDTEAQFHNHIRESHEQRKLQAKTVSEYIEKRFKGQHDSALFAVVGDFNDTPCSPYVKPLIKSPRLINILQEYRAVDDTWTYFWRDKNRVSQIDYILVSKALAQRIRKAAQNDGKKKPHIERKGLSYKTGKAGNILPATMIHFEEDPVTSKSAGSTAPEKSKVQFDHKRFKEIEAEWKKNISDHCPVKVWF